MTDLVILNDGPEDGARAMARDETLVRRQRSGEGPVTILRIHGWNQPVLSVGRSQPIPLELGPAAAEAGVELVRRPTGGGWLLHWPGDLAISVAFAGPLRAGELRRCSRQLAQAIALGLAAERRPAMVFEGGESATSRSDVCFQRVDRDEVVVDRTKVAGVALCRFGRTALVQSAVPLARIDDRLMAFCERWDPRRNDGVAACQGVDSDRLRHGIAAAFAAVGPYREGRPWSWPAVWLRDSEHRRETTYRASIRVARTNTTQRSASE